MRVIAAALVALLATACSKPSADSDAATRAPASAQPDAAAKRPRVDAPEPPPANRAPDAAADAPAAYPYIDQVCATETMRLQQTGPARATLTLRQRGGARRVATPPEMVAYTPLAIDCLYSPRDGSAYFAVQFGQPGTQCPECRWPYLLDLQGRPLHRSAPVWDGAGGARRANTREFDALRAAQQLEAPDFTPVQWR